MRKLLFSILFAAGAVVFSVRAELLIVKKEGDAFVPLSEQDVAQHSKQLQDILLKYQWPTVIMSDLTEQEQNELLIPAKPYAEEKFIEKKVQEVSPDYGVMFVPKTLYELFAIWQVFKNLVYPMCVIFWNEHPHGKPPQEWQRGRCTNSY